MHFSKKLKGANDVIELPNAEIAENFLRSIPEPYDWDKEPLTSSIIRDLIDGKRLQTRIFIHPMFKWCKRGKKEEGFKKALHFAEYLMLLHSAGDGSRGIPPQPHLQPNYAYNTIITACQRIRLDEQAKETYYRMLEHNLCPDVFTHTALIDVLGRCRDTDEAISIFETMKKGTVKPNIVTFVTVIRCLAFAESEQYIPKVFEVLREAEEAGKSTDGENKPMDPIIYNAALSACLCTLEVDPVRRILQRMKMAGTQKNEHTCSVLGQILLHHRNHRPNDQTESKRDSTGDSIMSESRDPDDYPISLLVQEGLLSEEDLNQIRSLTNQHGDKLGKLLNDNFAYCLGQSSSTELRNEVIEHDLEKLSERILVGQDVCRTDFQTLIHQCRKRKWPTETRAILDYMEDISANTVELSKGLVPPQPHLEPDLETYHAILEAFMSMGEYTLAWETLEELEGKGLIPDQFTFKILISGAIKCRQLDMASRAFWHMLERGVEPSRKIAMYSMRGFGADPAKGLQILKSLLKSKQLCGQIEGMDRILSNLLLESCAVIGDPQSSETVVKAMFETKELELDCSFLPVDADSTLALLMCCVSMPSQEESFSRMSYWQQKGVLCNEPFVKSVLIEAEYSVMGEYRNRRAERDTYPCRGFGYSGIMRTLSQRRTFLRTVMGISLKLGVSHTVSHVHSNTEGHDVVMESYCSCFDELSPFLFGHHVGSQMVQIRNKEAKQRLQNHIFEALKKCEDSWRMKFVIITLARLATSRLSTKIATFITREFYKFVMNEEYEDSLVALLKSYKLEVDVLRELTKETNVKNSNHDLLRKTLAQQFFHFLADEKESPTKVIQILRACNLEVLLSQHRMIETLVDHLLETDSSAIVVYVGKTKEKQVLFIRELIQRDEIQLATKYICRFHLGDEPEFEPYLKDDLLPPTFVHQPLGPTLELVLSRENVIVVENNSTLNKACEVLMQPSLQMVGMDCEWKPYSRGCKRTKCSLLQVATMSHAFLFDLMILEESWDENEEENEDSDVNRAIYSKIMGHLLSSVDIAKFGYGFDVDLQRLRWSFPDQEAYQVVNNLTDLSEIQQAVYPNGRNGLSAFVLEVIGFSLDKRMQMSNWETRPLSEQQINYAALDAYCLLQLESKIKLQS